MTEAANAGRDESAADTTGSARVLLGRAGIWVAELADLADRFQLPTVADLCAEVEQDRRRDSFRVAVVGEFNRGKSTLVNRQLGAELIPIRPVASTTGTVVARPSRSPRFDIERAAGGLDSLPLELESWADVGAGDRVTIWTDAAWLRDSDIELVDTAGSNTTADDHLDAARDAIRRADAVVFCVSAEQPMTRTERRFITREVLRRQVPHVLVALTMVDVLSPAALDTVMERTRRFLDGLGGVELFVGPGTDPEAADLLQERLTQLARVPGRALGRARTLAASLQDAAELCETAAEAGRAARRAHVAEMADQVESLQQAARESDAGWARLLAEFDGRGNALLEATRKQLGRDRDDLINRYLSELRTVHDPLLWWKEVLAVKAHEDLKRHAQQYTAIMLAQTDRDTGWLQLQAASLGFQVHAAAKPQVPAVTSDFAQPSVPLTDTSLHRRFARVAGNAGALTGATVGLMLGVTGLIVFSAAGGLGGNLLGEEVLRQVNAKNVTEARPLLAAALTTSFDQLSGRMTAVIPALYAEIGQSLREAARRARDVQISATQAELNARWQAAPDWDLLAAAAGRLANDIHLALRAPDTQASRTAPAAPHSTDAPHSTERQQS